MPIGRQFGTPHGPTVLSEVAVHSIPNANLLIPPYSTNAPLASTHHHMGNNGGNNLLLAYRTLGVVFGGLVTSPLYVYPSMHLKSPTEDDYLGIYSIMFWTLHKADLKCLG